jgi:hypothetical protein
MSFIDKWFYADMTAAGAPSQPVGAICVCVSSAGESVDGEFIETDETCELDCPRCHGTGVVA